MPFRSDPKNSASGGFCFVGGLFAILALAAGLRFATLGRGLRHAPHGDEQAFVESTALMLSQGDLDHPFYECLNAAPAAKTCLRPPPTLSISGADTKALAARSPRAIGLWPTILRLEPHEAGCQIEAVKAEADDAPGIAWAAMVSLPQDSDTSTRLGRCRKPRRAVLSLA